MVLIADHIIIILLVDVIVHIYNTLEKIREAQEANWICTFVMVQSPLGGPMELQISPKSHEPRCEHW